MNLNTWHRMDKIFFQILKRFPFKKQTILFDSFHGQYNDNPKYISEKIHEIDPEVRIVWVIGNDCNERDIPEYVIKIGPYSWRHLIYASRSQGIVDNFTGIRGFTRKNEDSGLINLLKSKKQMNISTWHGFPLKHIGKDIPGNENEKYSYKSSAYVSAGTDFSYRIFAQAFYPATIKMNGSPRNDILVKCEKVDVTALKEKLGIPVNKRIIVFAPTFRESAYESGIRQMNEIEINRFLDILSCKFGGDWVFVFRVHHTVLTQVDANKLIEEYSGSIISGNEHDDMAEYLAVADALLTDYSSCMFDYMLTKKPVFLLTMDKDHYCNDERGLYFSMDELPFPCAINAESLYRNVMEYDVETVPCRIEMFLNKIGNKEDGKASERIAKELIDFMSK